jgi:flagellar hook assembly protein FlgD
MIVKIDKAGAPTSTVRLSGMAQAIDARAYPNPASGAGTTIDVAASALGAGRMLEIVDRLGRTVRTLAAEAVSAGDVTRFRWDLADGDGVNVPAGLYFYRVTGASGTPVCGQVRVAR